MQILNYKIITLDADNIDNEDIVCARSMKDGVNRKKEWLIERFKEGLKFKVLKINGQSWGLIEYIPAEYAWRPIDAHGYMLINCFRVIGQFRGKGFGSMLLDECIKDSKGKKGIAIFSSAEMMMPKKHFFIHKGFEVCDYAPEYIKSGRFELLVKKFKKSKLPVFQENAKKGITDDEEGFTFFYTDQCPYIYRHIIDMKEAAELYDIPVKLIKFTSREQSQNSPAPFTTLSIFYKEKFFMHGIRKNEFGRFLEKIAGSGI